MKQEEYRIADHLPESLNRDNLRELAELIDEKMAEINRMSELVSIYPRIDKLSSNLVDALAVQFHVDYYDKGLPLDTRRSLVKNSMRLHLRKGTKGVVQEMVQTIFASGVVQEWYEYGGDPYYFRVGLMTSMRITPDNLNLLVKLINLVKNVRSWLDELDFKREATAMQYVGGAIHTNVKYEILPTDIKDVSIPSIRYAGGGIYHHVAYEVYPKA
ncbi:MAG: phage tail protein I [Clostridiales bacterium]|nr:MAG: phage tail protein I [Clostridiales bacterium]DAR09230.1 MAG TPA: tail protein [Caudoviricetes sp.]